MFLSLLVRLCPFIFCLRIFVLFRFRFVIACSSLSAFKLALAVRLCPFSSWHWLFASARSPFVLTAVFPWLVTEDVSWVFSCWSLGESRVVVGPSSVLSLASRTH